jgi:predicted dehydrogenase
MMAKRARIGIIGVGWWGTVGHLEPLAADPRAEIVAVWSRTEEKARDRAKRYGVARYYTDYRRMIDECELDGVIIATTPNVHYEQARYALEHGLHVLMEKPFVLRTDHAQDLACLAKQQDLLLTVCHPILYHPMMVEARRQIRDGSLGNVLAISALFSQRVYDLYKGDVSAFMQAGQSSDGRPQPNARSYADPAIVGGGEGHTQASHIIGAILWITGLRPASVFAYMNRLDVDVDVVDAMTIRFSGGALATVMANGLLPPQVGASSIHIQGDGGLLSFDSLGRTIYIQTAKNKHQSKITTSHHGSGGLAAVPRNFVRTILGEEELYVEPAVAIDEVRILDAAYRSATNGEEIDIET